MDKEQLALFIWHHEDSFWQWVTDELEFRFCEFNNAWIALGYGYDEYMYTDEELIQKFHEEFVKYAIANGDDSFSDCKCHNK